MSFEGKTILIAALLEIDLPSATVRLTDGGFVDWPARGMFTARHEDFGVVGSAEAPTEAVSDEAPGGKITLLPPSVTSASELFQPTAQGRAIRAWVAEVDPDTNEPVADPTPLFDGLIDTMTVTVDRDRREVEIEFIDRAEKLFMIREGNVLSPRFHKALWPGELGLDFATGAQVAVPWGIVGPSRGSVGIGSGGGGAWFDYNDFLGGERIQ